MSNWGQAIAENKAYTTLRPVRYQVQDCPCALGVLPPQAAILFFVRLLLPTSCGSTKPQDSAAWAISHDGRETPWVRCRVRLPHPPRPSFCTGSRMHSWRLPPCTFAPFLSSANISVGGARVTGETLPRTAMRGNRHAYQNMAGTSHRWPRRKHGYFHLSDHGASPCFANIVWGGPSTPVGLGA